MTSKSDEFWRFVGPEVPWILRQVRRLGVREADCEDLTQEVLMKVHARWEQYDPERPLRPWLFAFVFRQTSDHRRLMDNQPKLELSSSIPSGRPGPEHEVAGHRERVLLHDALDALTPDQRAAVVLVDLEGMSAVDAAVALEAPVNTVYSRLRAGRAALLAQVRQRTGGERP